MRKAFESRQRPCWIPSYSLSQRIGTTSLRNCHTTWTAIVENFLKGSLYLIPSPSPSVKIQIMGRKVCLRCKGKTLLGLVNKHLNTKSLLTFPQVNFSLNFHNLKVMGSNPGYLLKSSLLYECRN